MEQITDYKLLLDTAVLAGQLMLRNGAEIYRVEDTIHRILKVSGFKTTEAYVTSTGLIVTLDDPGFDSMTVVKRIHERDTDLDKITRVNMISRRFCAGEMSLKEAFHELKHMKESPYSLLQKDVCIVIVAAAFALLLGGTRLDALGAGIDGVLLVLFQHLSGRVRLNGFMQTMASSVVIALGALILCFIPGNTMNVDMIIIGAIMPLVPGAALTTAIRDTLQGDYVAGSAKLLEAFIKAIAIAVGVGVGMLLLGGIGQ